MQRLPHAHLHNAYGPTETTVDATGKANKSSVSLLSAVCVGTLIWDRRRNMQATT